MKYKIALAFAVVAVALVFISGVTTKQTGMNHVDDRSVDQFLAEHWSDPVKPQGKPPASLNAHDVSLSASNCNECHPQQYAIWKMSRHAHAVGPGLLWQLPILGQVKGNQCLRCHAPLTEQKALMAGRMSWPAVPHSAPPHYISPDLDLQGVTCAVCHVRRHEYFSNTRIDSGGTGVSPHGDIRRHSAFGDSRLCAHCHQFPDDWPRVNGKLQEDTYRQWRDSPMGKAGIQCQHCHMPGRQHLWRGIHDREMVGAALDVDVSYEPGGDHSVNLSVNLRNVGAGHHVPTYMVAKIIVNVAVDDGHTVQPVGREMIGWYVETDLVSERFDTRIPAGETYELHYTLDTADLPQAGEFIVSLDVHPREHYERMFRQVLGDPQLTAQDAEKVRQALDEAVGDHYQLLSQHVSFQLK